MRIAITGSTGLIGSALCAHLVERDHDVVRMVRRDAGPQEISWDPASGRLDAADLAGVEAVVHLAGAGIGDHRWTDEYRRILVESRVGSTRLLAERLAELGADGPSRLISGSAVGFYGDRDDEVLDETASAGDGFLAEICREWEAAAEPAVAAGVSVTNIRTGIVLTPKGGALGKMLPLFKLGLGGRFGSGRQWMSWISLTDELRAIEHLLASDVTGPVNLTAPNPCRNREFAAALGKAVGRPTLLPVPAFGPRLILGGDRADALLFESQRAVPAALERDGFEFTHPDLGDALRAELDRR